MSDAPPNATPKGCMSFHRIQISWELHQEFVYVKYSQNSMTSAHLNYKNQDGWYLVMWRPSRYSELTFTLKKPVWDDYPVWSSHQRIVTLCSWGDGHSHQQYSSRLCHLKHLNIRIQQMRLIGPGSIFQDYSILECLWKLTELACSVAFCCCSWSTTSVDVWTGDHCVYIYGHLLPPDMAGKL